MPKHRLLLMGSYNVEKTLMQMLMFQNRRFDDYSSTEPTEDGEEIMTLYSDYWRVHVIDCKQRKDFRPYNFSEYGNFFHQCAFFLFVLDAYASPEVIEEDFGHYIACLNKLQEKAPTAKVFIMLHKKRDAKLGDVDPIQRPWKTDEEYKELELKFKEITSKVGKFASEMKIYRTNIDNASYHAAWSDMLTAVEPRLTSLFTKKLNELLGEWGVDEIMLLEGHTLLQIAQADNGKPMAPDRMQKLATTLKRFNNPRLYPGRPFRSYQLRMANFQLVAQPFHRVTYLVVVTTNMDQSIDDLIEKIKALRAVYDETYRVNPLLDDPYYR